MGGGDGGAVCQICNRACDAQGAVGCTAAPAQMVCCFAQQLRGSIVHVQVSIQRVALQHLVAATLALHGDRARLGHSLANCGTAFAGTGRE